MQATDVRDREIERRLDAYARARLTPDPQAAARARARVMREARLQFEASRIAVHLAPATLVPRRNAARRIAMPLLAASVWLGIAVGSIAAAQPGGPLYPTRMWAENAALPAESAARAGAELDRLDARLAEAMAGAARGDAGAVAAALDAYNEISDAASALSAGDLALEARVAAALDNHRAVLSAVATTLASRGNDDASAAVEASIQRAIDHNQAVVDRIDAANPGAGSGSGAGGGTPAGPAASPPAGGGNVGGGDGTGADTTGGDTSGGGSGAGTTGGGGGADKPDATPKPSHDPTDPQGPPEHSPRTQNR